MWEKQWNASWITYCWYNFFKISKWNGHWRQDGIGVLALPLVGTSSGVPHSRKELSCGSQDPRCPATHLRLPTLMLDWIRFIPDPMQSLNLLDMYQKYIDTQCLIIAPLKSMTKLPSYVARQRVSLQIGPELPDQLSKQGASYRLVNSKELFCLIWKKH